MYLKSNCTTYNPYAIVNGIQITRFTCRFHPSTSITRIMGDYKFEGWLGLDEHSIGKMQWKQYEPKPFEETDVDIKISHSGICGVS